MDIAFGIIVVIALIAAVGAVARIASKPDPRAAFIAAYRFPPELFRRIRWKNADLTEAQVDLVVEGLRQYFLACLSGQRRGIAKQLGMPSRAVDDAWHEFIVMTRDYEAFCKQAFGKYLHHTPKEQMSEPTEKALANTLHQFRQPGMASVAMLGAVPLLFAIDRELGMKDGYHYDTAALDELEKVRHKMVAERSGGADGGGGEGGKDASPSSCDTSSGCGDGGGGSCGGGGGCGSS